MKISYDSTIDALYIKLVLGSHVLETRQIDHDINLDFDSSDRLVGIEVLDASKRLDLRYALSSHNEVMEYTDRPSNE